MNIHLNPNQTKISNEILKKFTESNHVKLKMIIGRGGLTISLHTINELAYGKVLIVGPNGFRCSEIINTAKKTLNNNYWEVSHYNENFHPDKKQIGVISKRDFDNIKNNGYDFVIFVDINGESDVTKSLAVLPLLKDNCEYEIF